MNYVEENKVCYVLVPSEYEVLIFWDESQCAYD